jgi:DNA-binding CsgD family transcriptional regulator
VFKKFVAPVVIAGLLSGGVAATAGTASATTPAPSTAAGVPATGGHHGVKAWLRAHRRQLRKAGLVISAQAIGVTPQALRVELQSGKSVAEVAGEHGVSVQTVVNALTSAADARVAQAVAAHKLSATQAAAIKAALPQRLTKAVNHVY